MMNINHFLVLFLLAHAQCTQAGIIDYFFGGSKENSTALKLSTGIAEQKEQLEHIKQEKSKLKAEEKPFNDALQATWDMVNKQEADVKAGLTVAQGKDKEILQGKLALLSEIHQKQFDLQFGYKELIATTEHYEKLLEEYLKDPHFKSLAPEVRTFYTIAHLQELNKKVSDQESKLKEHERQKSEILTDIENLKKKAHSAKKKYEEKQKEREVFVSRGALPETVIKEGVVLNVKQRGELLDLEEKLYGYELQLAELKIQEALRKNALFDAMIYIENEKLKALKKYVLMVKNALRVDREDVINERNNLEKIKQKSLAIREQYYETINHLTQERDAIYSKLEQLSKHYNIATGEDKRINIWVVEPKTPNQYQGVCEVGLLQVQLHLIDQKIDQLKAWIEYEQAKLEQKEVLARMVTSWYKITQRKLKDEEVHKELKRYKELEADAVHALATITDKRNALTNFLNTQAKELAALRAAVSSMVMAAKEDLFKQQGTIYNYCLSNFVQAEKIIIEQQDLSGKLIDIYSRIINTISETTREITGIIAELEAKTKWRRSEYAISKTGLNNIIPDMHYFMADVRTIGSAYINSLRWKNIQNKTTKLLQTPGNVVPLFIQLFGIIILYFLLRRIVPRMYNHIMAIGPDYRVFYYISRILGAMLSFINRFLLVLYIWVVLFVIVWSENYALDVYPKVLFYLLSIPFFFYLIPKLIHQLINFNQKHDHALFYESFTRRFSIIAAILLYGSTFIFFFREAYILATIHKSELPTILLALLSILIRISIIFCIGKEEILHIIPTRGALWQWLASFINRYYYLLLIAVIALMILSDPYIGGYQNIVSFILSGVLGTIFVVWIAYALYVYFKKITFYVFFETEEEAVHERFPHARTWYGIWVIFLFVCFIGITIYSICFLWDIPITYKYVKNIINRHLFFMGLDSEGLPIWVTPLKILEVIGFILSGLFVAYITNRFMLKRVFDELQVDVGIQNTVASITRYLIVIIAIFLGFMWAGLQTLLFVIGAVLISIGYIVKEPIGDLISYFILLVQRQIQIGDYIKLDEDTEGFVRHITPRSVVLRRKDSYTIIIPNSMFITKPVNNWSYARNFVAFDDIYLTVPYTTDPEEVRGVIAKVLHENTNVLKSPKPVIRLNDFSPDGFVFMLRGFLSYPKIPYRFDVASDVRFEIVKQLRARGIRIAVPTRYILTETDKKQIEL